MRLSDPINGADRNPGGSTSLGDLLDAVGPAVLRHWADPGGRGVEVSSVVLHDPLDELIDHRGAVLLLTGVSAAEPRAAEVLSDAARRGYSAVVVKCHGDDIQMLVDRAEAEGICLLTTPDDLSWMQLDGILLTMLGSRGAVEETLPADGEELFALANGMSAQIGGSVVIEDLDKRVLAYSSSPTQRIDAVRQRGILDRRVPQADWNAGQYLTVLAAEGFVRFPASDDEFPRAAISIRAGQRPLGTIWAIEGPDGLGVEAARALVDGAKLAALRMLRSHLGSRSELHRREPALRRALDGSMPASEIRFRLCHSSGDEITLIGLAAVSDGGSGTGPLITHIANELALHLTAYRSDASMVTTDRTVYVLLPAGDPAAAVRFADGARKAFDRVFPDEVRIGISASSTDVARLPVLRSEVDDIVRVLTTRTGCVSVASIEAVRLEVLLGHLADTFDHDPVLRHSGVDAMIAYDLEHSTHYSASVLAWVEALGDVAAAATVLDVHANTLRYRLRRVEELFSIMITDSDERLAAWLQLRADGSAVAVRGDRMQGSLAAVHVSGSPSEVAAAT